MKVTAERDLMQGKSPHAVNVDSFYGFLYLNASCQNKHKPVCEWTASSEFNIPDPFIEAH